MGLVKAQIPRAWLLPETDSGDRLQLVVAIREPMRTVDALKGFTNRHAVMIHEIAGALFSNEPDDSDNTFLGTFESNDARVPNYFEEYDFVLHDNPSDWASATYAVVSLMYYQKAMDTDDPQTYYFVVMYFDADSGIWRLPNERWQVECSYDEDVPTVDTHASSTISALVWEQGAAPIDPTAPTVQEALAAFWAP